MKTFSAFILGLTFLLYPYAQASAQEVITSTSNENNQTVVTTTITTHVSTVPNSASVTQVSTPPVVLSSVPEQIVTPTISTAGTTTAIPTISAVPVNPQLIETETPVLESGNTSTAPLGALPRETILDSSESGPAGQPIARRRLRGTTLGMRLDTSESGPAGQPIARRVRRQNF